MTFEKPHEEYADCEFEQSPPAQVSFVVLYETISYL
jgi:hypothetical protein